MLSPQIIKKTISGWTTASVGTAVHGAAMALKERLLTAEQTVLWDGRLQRKDNAAVGLSVVEILRGAGLQTLAQDHTAQPAKERDQSMLLAHGAQFVEVRVDEQLGTVRVARAIEATTCGKIMNPKTARELGMVGIPAAIANAVFYATGRDLLITLDKVLRA